MLPLFVLELVEPEVEFEELELDELELLDDPVLLEEPVLEEPVLEESDASVEAASSLSDSLFVDWITFSAEISAWSPNHFFWITLITPPFFKEFNASDTAFCSSTLAVGAATQ